MAERSLAASVRSWHPAVTTALLAASTFGVGRIALLDANLSGLSTPFSPGAGLAAGALLVLGLRFWPGVLLGAFALGLSAATSEGRTLSGAAWMVAAGTGVASTLHAVLAAVLVKRVVGYPSTLHEPRDVVRCLAFVGPVPAVASATIGVSTLVATGVLPFDGYLHSWLTRWIGESIGGALLAPVVLSLLGEPEPEWRARRRSVGVPLAGAALAVFVLLLGASTRERAQLRLELSKRAATLAHALQQDERGHLDVLRSTAALWDASEHVSADEFETFAGSALAAHPRIVALGWVPRLSGRDRVAFEREQAQRTGAPFEVFELDGAGARRQAGVRTEYFPIAYMQPDRGFIGYDLGSSSPRRAALLVARRGQPAATAPIDLVDRTRGFLVVHPVFVDAVPTPESHAGVIGGAFRAGQAVDAAFRGLDRRGLHLSLVDCTEPVPVEIHGDDETLTGAPARAYAQAETVHVADRSWQLLCAPTRTYVAAFGGWGDWVLQLGALVSSGLIATLLLIVSGRTRRVEELVEARTRDLVRSNDALIAEASHRREVEAELRKQEAASRVMVETIEDYAIVRLDCEGRIVTWNRGAERIHGYVAEEILGKSFSVFYPENDRDAGKPISHLGTVTGGEVVRTEGWRGRQNGPFFWADEMLSPIRDDEESVTGVTKVTRDMTRRKQFEEDLRRRAIENELVTTMLRDTKKTLETTVKQLEASNQELDDFAYIASHDLKEPLRGIHNYANFLLEDYGDKLDEEGVGRLHTLTRLTQRMEELIDSLLYFSRVGRIELAMESSDLNEVIEDIVESLEVTIQEKNVVIRIPEPLPVLRCDRVRVREVYRNLITNAIKYNDKPERVIELGAERGRGPRTEDGAEPSAVDPQAYALFVKDNGIGIREKHLESVFRIFKRLHGRDKFGGGTGAGLTFVKKIIERHGGRVWIESVYGEGTTVFFNLGEGTEQDGERKRSDAVHTDR